jgi:hypothetical protein
MYLNGIMLISTMLYFQTARPDPGNDLPYILFLPTYAATAWYHHRVLDQPTELPAYTDEVEEFPLGDYASVLLRGSRVSDRERQSVLTHLARYTGLSPDFLERCDLPVTPQRFL